MGCAPVPDQEVDVLKAILTAACALLLVLAQPTAKALDTSGPTKDQRRATKARSASATALLVRQERRTARPARSGRSLQMHLEDAGPREAICAVFVADCGDALRVARCESRFDVNARNGQYLGLFQMGSWERRTFGHGQSAIAQTRAAHRYFVASGRDWSPWECKP